MSLCPSLSRSILHCIQESEVSVLKAEHSLNVATEQTSDLMSCDLSHGRLICVMVWPSGSASDLVMQGVPKYTK